MSSRPALALAALLSLAAACGGPGNPLPDGGTGGSNGGCETDAQLCLARGKNCGALTVTDRCGKTVTAGCGSCTAPQTCGGAGTDNVCAATCPGGCPAGYSCNLFGVCGGGTSSSLTLDVKAVAVSGVVTLNGQTPLVGTGCSSNPTGNMVTLNFFDPNTGTTVTDYVLCSSSNFGFSTMLAPGKYKVTVSPYILDRSNVPSGSFVVDPGFTVAGAASNAVFDVKTVSISGRVTLNGQTPLVGTGCTSSPTGNMVTLNFLDATTGSAITQYIPCSASNSAFTAQLPPGTYLVSAAPYINDRTNLPHGTFTVDPAFVVTAAATGVTFDVKAVAVGGSVTLNGAVPQVGTGCTSSPTGNMVTLNFLDASTGTSVTDYVLCSSSNYAFSTMLAPGTYAVTVAPYINDRTNLPHGTFVVNPSLAVSAAASGVVLDVKAVAVGGTVTLNGQTPQVGTGCSSSPTGNMVTVNFVETTTGSRVTDYVLCSSSNYAFSTMLAPGTWRALVGPYISDRTNIPNGTFMVDPGVTVANASTALALDVKTINIAGNVTLNSATPQVGTGCSSSPTGNMVTLQFVDSSAPLTTSFLAALRALPTTNITQYIPCSAGNFAFTAQVTPGTYRVSVAPYINDRSNLPHGTFVVSPRLELK